MGFGGGAEWEECGFSAAGYFEEGEGGFAVCIVSGGDDCFDEESAFYGLFYEQVAGAGEGAWDQDEDAGEVGGETFGDGLDVDEEEGAI